jgi:hypothetical protein
VYSTELEQKMNPEEWVPVYTADGKLAAEMIKITLESFGIPSVIFQESLGLVYGLTVGPLGENQVLVPSSKAVEAMEILKAMEDGRLEERDDNPGTKESNKDDKTDILK